MQRFYWYMTGKPRCGQVVPSTVSSMPHSSLFTTLSTVRDPQEFENKIAH